MTAKYGTPYFSNYINSDMEPSDVRSMCPLFKNEKVLVRDDYSGEFHISTVENLYKGHKKEKTYDVILNGKAKKASLHRFDGLTFYKIRTVNGTEVIFSGNHENLVYGGAVKTTDQLTTNDYLPFNITPIEGSGLTYEDGLMVGAFLGDGSLKDDYTVVYSLNNTTKQSLAGEITRIAKERFGAKMRETQVSEHCINFNITSQMLRGLIEEYVSGKALEKELNAKCIGRSKAFRAGIADGYQATDGSDNKRIYSASKKAIESVAALYTSLGYATNIAVDTRDGKETYSYNPVYCIRPYAHNTTHRSNVYINENGYMWFRIESVEKVDTDSQIGYCFEVLGDEEPYFTLPSGLVTHNCRLRLDLRELRKKSGGFFGSGESTGSIGVVTINMPRIGYLAKDEADFYKRLDRLMDIAARSLKTKRTAITKYMEDGLYPYTKRYLGTFENHFSTIGLVGMNEACLNANWIREDMSHEKAQKFTKDVLNHMRERLSDYQELYGDLYNLEATPAESTAYRFAKHDKEKYPDIITANMSGDPYYTNSSHLPVGFTEDIFSALDIQDELQTLYTSGTVFHAFLGEKLPSWRSAAALVRKIAENYRLPYYTISPTYSVCKDHGYLSGEQAVCPYCGKETEIYSRITGYYRPIANWNAGKKSEWMERRPYAVSSSCLKSSKRLICTTLNGTESTTSNETARATKVNAGMAAGANTDTKTAPTAKESEVMLFKTPTCPNCKTAMTFLQKAGVKYQIVDAEDAGNRELVDKFGIRQAPTLIVEKDGKVEKLRGVSEIAGWLKNAANQ